MRKRHTEDDIHDILGLALEIVKDELNSTKASVRLDAAIQVLHLPITLALSKQQTLKDEFPDAIDVKDNAKSD